MGLLSIRGLLKEILNEQKNPSVMVPVDIQGQYITLDVDTLATESAVPIEIDTSAESPPYTILTPSPGKKLDTRGVYIFTDSDSGEITIKFANSGKVIAKAYVSKFRATSLPSVRFTGDTNEPLQVEWSGLSTGAKIFVVVRYKEI